MSRSFFQTSPTGGRRAAITILLAVFMVTLLSVVAFAVDLGYVAVVRNELQNAADAAALAGAQQLMSRELLQGADTQYTGVANARSQAVTIAGLNKGGKVSLALDPNTGNSTDGDVVVGFIQSPSDASSSLEYVTTPYNSVRVTIHRDEIRNGALDLFFARVMGQNSKEMTAQATATVQGYIRGFKIRNGGPPTSKLLPFALDVTVWQSQILNGAGMDTWDYDPDTNTYTPGIDGIPECKLYPNKGLSPGNFGTIDIGNANNSTADISRQIVNGPNASDLGYYTDGEFKLNSFGFTLAGGETGISAGFEDELLSVRGKPRIIPLYLPPVIGTGNNATFTIVGFAGVVITEVELNGPLNNKHLTIQPEFVIDNTAIGGGTSSSSYYVYKGVAITR